MDDTFNKDLCAFACQKINYMLENDGVVFTRSEIAALIAMKKTLQFLVKRHKPADLIKKLHSFAEKAGFYKGSKLYTIKIEKKLIHYAQMIIEGHASAQKLITLLEKIIVKKSRQREHVEADDNAFA
jgi:hypothetical protein